MSTEPGSADMKGSVRLYPLYRTKLGEAIFPGTDVFTLELRGFFNEMLAVHFEEGGLPGVEAFGVSLAKFTPRSIDETPVEWKDTVLKRWIHEQRPFIFQSMHDYLVLGGYQARVEVQTALVDEMLAAGLEIEGVQQLRERLAFAGDWHAALLSLGLKGRPMGIRFVAGGVADRGPIKQALCKAGFTRAQSASFLAGI